MKSSFHNTQSWGESFCAKRIFERALNWLCTSVGWVLPTSLWERQRRERCIVTLDTSHQSPWGATGCIVSRTAGEIFNGQPKYQIAKISPSFLQRLIEAVCYPSQMYSDELNHNLNDCVVSTINQENLQNYQNLILWKRFRNGAFHAKGMLPAMTFNDAHSLSGMILRFTFHENSGTYLTLALALAALHLSFAPKTGMSSWLHKRWVGGKSLRCRRITL